MTNIVTPVLVKHLTELEFRDAYPALIALKARWLAEAVGIWYDGMWIFRDSAAWEHEREEAARSPGGTAAHRITKSRTSELLCVDGDNICVRLYEPVPTSVEDERNAWRSSVADMPNGIRPQPGGGICVRLVVLDILCAAPSWLK